MTDDTDDPSGASAFELAAEEWWAAESADWDNAVAGTPVGSIWGGMPVVDSKAVARLAPIFKKLFGRALDTRLIRPGGYSSISEAARDLESKFHKREQLRQSKKGDSDGAGRGTRGAWRKAS